MDDVQSRSGGAPGPGVPAQSQAEKHRAGPRNPHSRSRPGKRSMKRCILSRFSLLAINKSILLTSVTNIWRYPCMQCRRPFKLRDFHQNDSCLACPYYQGR